MATRMSIRSAAKLLNVKPQWAYRMARARGLGVRLEGRVWLTAEEVETIRATRRPVGHPSSQQSAQFIGKSAKVVDLIEPNRV